MSLTVRDAAGVTRTLATATDEADELVPQHRVSGLRVPTFREEFRTFDTDTVWRLVQTGTGQVISVDGASSGARYLKIAAGTEVGETIIQSRQTFRVPCEVTMAVTLSQRIANQAVHVELVEVDAAGDLVVDTAIEAGADLNGARNGAGMCWDGTSANNCRYYVRTAGNPQLASAATTFGTGNSTAAGTTPNFTPPHFMEMTVLSDLVTWAGQAIDSATVGTGYKRTQSVPEPNRTYAVRIRVKNTATVTATDVRIHFVRVMDAHRIPVDFSLVNGRSDGQLAPAVHVASMPTTNVTTTFGTAGGTAYSESTTPLAGAASVTGTSRDAGSTNGYRTFVTHAVADVAGTVYVENSTDNATWYVQHTQAVSANVPVVIEAPVVARYYRARYVNGASPQASFALRTAYHRT